MPSEINDNTTLDAADAAPLQDFTGLKGLRDTLPDAHEVCALAREHKLAVFVLHALEEDFDLIPDFQVIAVREFCNGTTPSDLNPMSTETSRITDGDDASFDDLAFADLAERSLIQLQEVLVLGLVVFAVFNVQPT